MSKPRKSDGLVGNVYGIDIYPETPEEWEQYAIQERLAGQIEGAEKFITDSYGKRCETKDLDDFPELKHSERCLCCKMWEDYDDWKANLKGGRE
jgi:hypothetical protein